MAISNRTIYGVVEAEIVRAIEEAVESAVKGSTNMVIAFARGMEVGAKGDMAKTNRLVAKEAHAAVEDAYARNVEAVRRTPSYARYDRRSGYLGRVIRRPDFVSSDHSGIQYGNEAALYKEAEHWRRLNFGAGAAAGPQDPAIPLRLFGETVGSLGLGHGPSPAFSLPKGFFLNASGKLGIPNANLRGSGAAGEFYPNRKSPYTPRVTEGIRGRHFLEEGLEEMAVQIEVRYADLLNEWVQRGGRKAKAVAGAS